MQNKVIIFGGSHHNTLGVVRSLGEKGIKPYVIIVDKCLKDSFVLKSKYIEKGWVLESEDKGLCFIIESFARSINKSIIICTSDSTSSCVDSNYDKLINYFYIPNGKEQGTLSRLMTKYEMNRLAETVGLVVPKTWFAQDIADITDVEYPCITKPLQSTKGSKSDIVVCDNKEKLIDYFEQKKEDSDILIQKYIKRDFEFQLIGCSLDGGAEIIIPGYTKIIRSTSVTNTGFLEYHPISNLNYDQVGCENFIRACNYSGLFSLEFIRDKEGNDYFLEINFRNDGNAYSVTAAGVNIPYIWVNSFVNKEVADCEKNNPIKSILVMPELVDIYQVFKRKITLRKWINDLKNTDCFLYYHKYDKKPFYNFLYYQLMHVVKILPKKITNQIFIR